MRTFGLLGCSVVLLGAACQQTATRPAAPDQTQQNESAPWTAAQVVETIKHPPRPSDGSMVFNTSTKEEDVTDSLHVVRDYEPTDGDRPLLLAAMRDKSSTISFRLCVARWLLKLGDPEARAFVATTLDGNDRWYARGAVVVLLDSAADKSTGDWSIDQMLRVIQDVTPLPPSEATSGNTWTRAGSLLDGIGDICDKLAQLHVRRAVPVLIHVIRTQGPWPGACYALGELGDPAAIPVLVENLEYQARDVDGPDPERRVTRLNGTVARVLDELHYGGLEPVLLRHLDDDDAIRDLNRMHDPGIVPALEAWLRTHDDSRIRLCIAINGARDNHDEALRLCILLDASPDWRTQYQILDRLARTKDPIGVASARRVALTAPPTIEGNLAVGSAMDVLKAVHNDEAIDALIAIFERDYSKFKIGKFTSDANAEMHHRVGQTLEEITGQHFGADAARWHAWYKTHRAHASIP